MTNIASTSMLSIWQHTGWNMDIFELRDIIGQEIVDFNQLKSVLHHYVHPRGKISKWLTNGDLIRVKKGLYVFGPEVQRTLYSSELVANLIYGPSAISLQYALAFYGLIPEAVYTVTSITNKRNKEFTTPIGQFTYRYLAREKYAVGIQLLTENGSNFIIATPEKALCDYIVLECKNIDFESVEDVNNFLFNDMRIDDTLLAQFSPVLFHEIVKTYNIKRLNKFYNYYMKEKV